LELRVLSDPGPGLGLDFDVGLGLCRVLKAWRVMLLRRWVLLIALDCGCDMLYTYLEVLDVWGKMGFVVAEVRSD
jgi:hypothetical protein